MASTHPLRWYTTTRPDLLPLATQFPALLMATVTDATVCPAGVLKAAWASAHAAVAKVANIPDMDQEDSLEYIQRHTGTFVRLMARHYLVFLLLKSL